MIKILVYWCRWVLLAPAYVLGAAAGPLFQQIFISYYFPNMTDQDPVLVAVFDLVTSAFGAFLLCAYVAPNNKKAVGIWITIFLMIEGVIMGMPNSGLQGPASPWIIAGSYALGASAAYAFISWHLSSKKDQERTGVIDK